jgi:hypothetical protein
MTNRPLRIAAHVNVNKITSATPGRTAHAISPMRLVVDVGSLPGTRAGDTMAERMIAT